MNSVANFPRLRRAALDSLQRLYSNTANAAHRAMLERHIAPLSQFDVRSFLLPENGAIIDEGTKSKLTLETCRLPFTRCALEYSISPEHYRNADSGKWQPAATVLLVEQHEDGGLITANCIWREDNDAGSVWIASPTGFGLSEQTTIEISDRSTVLLDKLVITYSHDAFKPSSETDLNAAVNDFAHEAAVLAHFTLLCSCQNVSTTKIFEPSKKLVKRAEERGNLAPDEYYVLDCFLGENKERAPRGEGKHAPPRFHVRRGHVRRLQNNSLTWVKQTTVGDIAAGTINKDYRVLTRSDDSTE